MSINEQIRGHQDKAEHHAQEAGGHMAHGELEEAQVEVGLAIAQRLAVLDKRLELLELGLGALAPE